MVDPAAGTSMGDTRAQQPSKGFWHVSPHAPSHPTLESVAKLIKDLEQLVTLLRQSLSHAKPWQRQLSAHLTDVDTQLQVLRLSVSLERQTDEILAAAAHVAGFCRLAAVALAGSRIDPTTRSAVHLIVELAKRIHADLSCLQ